MGKADLRPGGGSGNSLPPLDNDTVKNVGGLITADGGRIIPSLLTSRLGTLDTFRQGDVFPLLRPESTWRCTINGTTTVTPGASTLTVKSLNVRDLRVGQTVTGTGIPVGATIATINVAANTFTLSAAATASNVLALIFGTLDLVAPVQDQSRPVTAAFYLNI